VHCDVVVVGGGPAGAAAATTAARRGLDVVVLDKARFPRDKTCGDGLTTDALRRLEALGLDPHAVPSWTPVGGLVARSPSGRRVDLPFPDRAGTHGAVARRAELDAAVLDLARAAGAEVLDGHGCTGATERGDRVVVEADGLGSIHARYAIGADGAWSPLRKYLGVGEEGRSEWHGLRQYLAGVDGPASSELFVWFEPDLLPAYAWSFPLGGGTVNAGFGYERGHGPPLAGMVRHWREVLARPHVAEALGREVLPTGPARTWPIPARLHRARLHTRRTLFVGDATGATDPVTGEGIGQALLTGVAAADAVADTGPWAAGLACQRYARAVRRGLGATDRLSRVLLRIVRHGAGVRGGVRVASSGPVMREFVARWLFEDVPRTLPLTPHRWRAEVLDRPGAFHQLSRQ
jgi:menaquinone-9 beta-reductase